jgi:hypothetical protein
MPTEPILLSWTQYVPVSEGQDPLGLNLRVNARLAGQLFYCITSITPRARYYAFFAWAVSIAREMGPATLLRERLRLIEKAYAMACVARHEGTACTDGRLVGIEEMTKWYGTPEEALPSLTAVEFAKTPALDAYWASLLGLGLFKTEDEQKIESTVEEPETIADGDVELSDAGLRLAAAYAATIEGTFPVERLKSGCLSRTELSVWGEKGCLCALSASVADRDMLRDLFFNREDMASPSHRFRRDTLLLLLQIADLLADAGCPLDEKHLGEFATFGAVRNQEGLVFPIGVDPLLDDILCRWAMFYTHYYLTAALEHLFVCVMVEANVKSLEGFTLSEFVSRLGSESFNSGFRAVLGISYDGMLTDIPLGDLYKAAGLEGISYDKAGSEAFSLTVGLVHPLSESRLLDLIKPKTYWGTLEALAIGFLLTMSTVMRFLKDEQSPYGNWLSNAVNDDPYGNVTVPVVAKQLRTAFGDPLTVPIRDVLSFLLEHDCVRLHQSLAYQKSGSFLYTEEGRIRGRKRYEWPSYGNGRLPSAVLILKDLGLLFAGDAGLKVVRLTADGRDWLKAEFERIAKA